MLFVIEISKYLFAVNNDVERGQNYSFCGNCMEQLTSIWHWVWVLMMLAESMLAIRAAY